MKSRTQQGFTLIELLVVIAIIAILAGLIFPVLAKTRKMARKTICRANLKTLAVTDAAYLADYGVPPMSQDNVDPTKLYDADPSYTLWVRGNGTTPPHFVGLGNYIPYLGKGKSTAVFGCGSSNYAPPESIVALFDQIEAANGDTSKMPARVDSAWFYRGWYKVNKFEMAQKESYPVCFDRNNSQKKQFCHSNGSKLLVWMEDTSIIEMDSKAGGAKAILTSESSADCKHVFDVIDKVTHCYIAP